MTAHEGAYRNQPPAAIAATANLLRWLRAFIASDCVRAHNPLNQYASREGDEITKDRARAMLHALVIVAINRKAGIPDDGGKGRYFDTGNHPIYGFGLNHPDLERDARAVRDHAERRIAIHQFNTSLSRRRLGHLLSDWNE